MIERKPAKRLWKWWSIALLLGVAVAVFLLFQPWNIGVLDSHPRPERDYSASVQHIERLRANEPAAMNPVCRLQWMTHGQQTERAIVLVHGNSACPQQFNALGKQFYDLGFNVLIVPLPHHGLADRLTRELAELTAEELAAYADEVVDIAQGFGKRVTVAGISGGAVVTAWVAQHRTDVDLAVLISPAFGVAQVPTNLTTAVVNVCLLLPDFYLWWDPDLKEEGGTPDAYAGFSTRGLAQIIRLGEHVQSDARRAGPAARSILVVTNANDTAIDMPLVDQVVADWRNRGAAISTYQFAADLRLDHDLIDPEQPKQRIDIVYPTLIKLVTR